jgi:hypothetical protein
MDMTGRIICDNGGDGKAKYDLFMTFLKKSVLFNVIFSKFISYLILMLSP